MPSPPKLPMRDRFRAAIKAAQVAFAGYGGSPWGYGISGTSSLDRWYYGLPGTNVDWQVMAGDLWQSSVVAIALHWIARNITEPVAVVRTRKGKGNEPEDDPDHPLCQLINKPNPYYGWDNLSAALAVSFCTAGNGYWIKAKGTRTGQARELLYIPHWQMRPIYPTDGSAFITGYSYRVDGRQPVTYKASDVVHFRYGLDPYNYRLGWAPLGPQLRQVATDNEASTYEAALLANMGIAPVMLSAGDAAGINEENRKLLEERVGTKYTGDGRGRWLVVGVPMKADTIGANPEALAIPSIRRVSASRIVASLGLTLALLGLDDRATGFDNGGQHNEARRAAYQDCIIPILKTWAATLTQQLGPDFDLQDNQEVAFDFSDVEALSEDADAVSARATAEFQGGGITLNEYRRKIGEKDLGEAGDVVFVGKGGELIKLADLETHAAQNMAPPEPPPGLNPESTGDQAALGNGNDQPAALATANGNGQH